MTINTDKSTTAIKMIILYFLKNILPVRKIKIGTLHTGYKIGRAYTSHNAKNNHKALAAIRAYSPKSSGEKKQDRQNRQPFKP
jgi:hypothetical protein